MQILYFDVEKTVNQAFKYMSDQNSDVHPFSENNTILSNTLKNSLNTLVEQALKEKRNLRIGSLAFLKQFQDEKAVASVVQKHITSCISSHFERSPGFESLFIGYTEDFRNLDFLNNYVFYGNYLDSKIDLKKYIKIRGTYYKKENIESFKYDQLRDKFKISIKIKNLDAMYYETDVASLTTFLEDLSNN